MANPHTIVVTGASTGIGAACAGRLASLGYRVFAGVRRAEDGDRLRAEHRGDIVPVRLDVTQPAEIAAAVDQVRAVVGERGLDGLVNNAGLAVGGPIEFLPVDEVRRQFEVNVFGLLAVTQAFLPLLRTARGRIVNMGSIAGKSVSPFVGPYCMSKHAVEALTDALRLELADAGIQVSVIEPGAVKTPIWSKGASEFARIDQILPPTALDRYGAKLAFFAKVLEANDRRGVPAAVVADAVVDALENAEPRTRYLVGIDAKVRAWISRWLPDRAGDAFLRTMLRRMQRRMR
ncbi:MAG: SDR family oxidoreductase [Gemmatimonadales bacterium]